MSLLDGAAAIPTIPGYYCHADGRVVSVKKDRPTVLAVDDRSPVPRRWTVRLGRSDLRVYDLVAILHGLPAARRWASEARYDIEDRHV